MCKADLSTAEVRDSVQSVCGEREKREVEYVPRPPLMMCSVKMVDCRTVELIPPVTNAEKENDEEGEPNAQNEDLNPPSVSFT